MYKGKPKKEDVHARPRQRHPDMPYSGAEVLRFTKRHFLCTLRYDLNKQVFLVCVLQKVGGKNDTSKPHCPSGIS